MKNNRIASIYSLCQQSSRVMVDDLSKALGVSAATIRRDLQEMEEKKLVNRFYGGAVLNKDLENEPTMHAKHLINMQKKTIIARYAASLIKDNDVVYIDAGTTTEEMIDYIYAKNILVVTQALSVMDKLYERQIRCYTLGGYIKFSTNIIIDNDTIEKMAKMNFNISFLGCNGINAIFGFSTTNEIEAMLKKLIIAKSETPYILADSNKFNQISNIKFAGPKEAVIITDELLNDLDYSAYGKIIAVTDLK
ncbi:MAG: DeoR/GlpR family DNA-binding transcription regulator [Erysipelotrichaceae bacterium]|nr:DeoR/GlpR family DNA-binding transcription regulator [Erysipelotrichaceae bacterium]